MTDPEELKHARARIEADGKTIAELRAMLETLNGHSNQLVNQGVEAVRLKDVYRLKLQAMRRRAQRAESRLDRLQKSTAGSKLENLRRHIRSLGDRILSLRENAKERRIKAWTNQPSAIAANASQCGRTRAAAEWASERVKQFYDKRLGEPWAQPEPEIFEAHGREWYRHAPGDAMPCDGEMKVRVLWREELHKRLYAPAFRAEKWLWIAKPGVSHEEIIGWRPADAPTKLVRPKAAACGQCADKVEFPRDWTYCPGCSKPLE